MEPRPLSDRTALFLRGFSFIVVTGGSSGIGRALLGRIEESATSARVCNVSRTIPEGWAAGPDRVHLPCDLSKPAEVEAVAAALRELMPREGRILLVNNSGFGAYGEFPAPGLAHNLGMLDVNVRAPVHLTGLLWPELLARGGMVANVASLAGYQPVPLMATYAATKAFLLNWSVALDTEGRPRGVRSVAICPGPVSTNFFRGAGFSQPTGLPGQTALACVDEALEAMASGRAQVVTGWSNRALSWFGARLPKPWAAALGLRAIERKLGRRAR
jgi:short-subunit dehydrogenase